MTRRLLVGACAALVACRGASSEETVTPGAASPGTPVAASATPADHLAPGELVEGAQEAFGVKLPREVHVEQASVGVVTASGPVGVHPLLRYLKPRLQEAHVTEGDRFATLDHVKVPGKPGTEFRIRLTAVPPSTTLLEMRDTTPPPAPNLPDEAARWKQVGLTPDGKIADPSHLD